MEEARLLNTFYCVETTEHHGTFILFSESRTRLTYSFTDGLLCFLAVKVRLQLVSLHPVSTH